MLSDISSECKSAKADTAAIATLAVALAWAHIGEADRAKEMHAEATTFACKDSAFRSVLTQSGPVLGVA